MKQMLEACKWHVRQVCVHNLDKKGLILFPLTFFSFIINMLMCHKLCVINN